MSTEPAEMAGEINKLNARITELEQALEGAEGRLVFASDVCRNQQHRINELERRLTKTPVCETV